MTTQFLEPPPVAPEGSPGADEVERRQVAQTWSRPPGFYGWLTSTHHKDIGLRFIVTAFLNFGLAGLLALAMRTQLAVPRFGLLGPDLYNQFFTTHGTAMMFLFAVPVMEGFAVYLVPLMVGTRNVSFPRLLNYGYYVYLIASGLLWTGLVLNMGPDVGWFAYVPLSGPEYGIGKRVDLWSQMVTLVEISTLVGAIEIITTVFKQKAPGMGLNRLPLFVWAQVITGFMILFAMPAVMLCSTMLSMDRLTNVSTHFYNPAEGGDALLWQHLFWFFAHPEVYIIFMPATGFVSAIVPVFSRRKLFGYTPMVLSLIATAFIGFGVWVHHMFATPLPELGQGMFTASSLMIVIPNGVQIFCWLATMWGGKLHFKTPMLFVFGFIATFVIGGLTGVILASVSLDLQVHDTYFVVAHLHYVLIGGAVFPLFGACYYWFPKFTGRMLGEKLGRWNFALLFVGFHMTFWPMHHLGLHGMARRVYTYPAETGWGFWNHVASSGAAVMGLSVLLFLVNVVRSRRHGPVAGNDPWGADSLEWGATSPPPDYNFLHPPSVQGRHALWVTGPDAPVVVGLSTTKRQTLVTTTLDAVPDHKYEFAGETIWPLLLAVTTAFILIGGGIFHPMFAVAGLAPTFVVLVGWFWTARKAKEHPNRHPLIRRAYGRETATP